MTRRLRAPLGNGDAPPRRRAERPGGGMTKGLGWCGVWVSGVAAAMSGAMLLTSLSAAPARAQEVREVDVEASARVACFWDRLPPLLQLRLELWARTGGGLPISVIDRLGAPRVARLMSDCGVDFDPVNIAIMSRYWIYRADVEVLSAQLWRAGVLPALADSALEVTAPPGRRAAFAEEIMTDADTEADEAILAAIAVMQELRGSFGEDMARLLARYFTAKILADGLAFGAQPPGDLTLPEGFDAAPDPSGAWTNPDAQ